VLEKSSFVFSGLAEFDDSILKENGADERNRTGDLRFTKAPVHRYVLSPETGPAASKKTNYSEKLEWKNRCYIAS
jgi:hypothetical protein